MRSFKCGCGARAFFENSRCLACQATLGFDPGTLQMRRLQEKGAGKGSGGGYRSCKNQLDFENCNWLVPESEPDPYCLSCRLNRTIPDLSREENLPRWRTLEMAKRRLLYSLLVLGLPVKSKLRGWPDGLAFDFIEDQRSNPLVWEQFVNTGHLNGVITINIAEADDIFRLQMRKVMGELNRTVLGHLRHESGHFYFNFLIDNNAIETFRHHFGDERTDYTEALDSYYGNGPDRNWNNQFISAYASSHPLEDWAETWAHYLLIKDSLETAEAEGLLETAPDFDHGLRQWMEMAVTINQVSRGLGLDDLYPHVITNNVRDKFEFINGLLSTPSEPA